MSVDLNFWKYQDGVYLDHEMVYQNACCEHQSVEGVETLPVEAILGEVAAAFSDWTALDPLNYENAAGPGSFQISTTPQTVRFDCYSMEAADMKRFSAVLARFGCPLYDPQQGVRFDKLAVFLTDEAREYQAQIETALARLFPRLERITQTVTWEEYTRLSKMCGHIQYQAMIHRAKTQTKTVSFLRFGNAWANRACQCKTAQLENPERARQLLGELLEQSLERAAQDFFAGTYYD